MSQDNPTPAAWCNDRATQGQMPHPKELSNAVTRAVKKYRKRRKKT